MKDNPLAAIEFFAFIGFVIWLFLWQNGSSRRRSSERSAQHDGQAKGND
jgi:hypothetical protein